MAAIFFWIGLPKFWTIDIYLPVRYWKFSSFSERNHEIFEVNKQDFLQVSQVSRMGKMEDNLTSVDKLSYTTNGSIVDPGSLVSDPIIDNIELAHHHITTIICNIVHISSWYRHMILLCSRFFYIFLLHRTSMHKSTNWFQKRHTHRTTHEQSRNQRE